MHLGETAVVWYSTQRECAHDRVEAGVAERQLLSVGVNEAYLDALGRGARSGDREHPGGEVDAGRWTSGG